MSFTLSIEVHVDNEMSAALAIIALDDLPLDGHVAPGKAISEAAYGLVSELVNTSLPTLVMGGMVSQQGDDDIDRGRVEETRAKYVTLYEGDI